MHEGRRLGLQHPLDGALGERRTVVGALRKDIQQDHWDAGIGDMGGDAGPHYAGADHREFLDIGHGRMPRLSRLRERWRCPGSSAERRVGKGWGSPWSPRWLPYP